LPRELEVKELERYETCVAVGATHPLAKSKFVSLKQVASEPVAALTRKDYPHYHKHLEKLFARKPRISSEHDSGTSLMSAVAAGHEVALLPSCVNGASKPACSGFQQSVWRVHSLDAGLSRPIKLARNPYG
jgi:DNA-binding transcriptional LysR family regulator